MIINYSANPQCISPSCYLIFNIVGGMFDINNVIITLLLGSFVFTVFSYKIPL